jgi:hypothetical protein
MQTRLWDQDKPLEEKKKKKPQSPPPNKSNIEEWNWKKQLK